ncbi:MAG TPA: peptidoglycan recognition family protein [Blastocatellia bacterium]
MLSSHQEFEVSTALVDKYSRYIESPVQRLKFLDSVLKKKSPRNNLIVRLVRYLPFVGSLDERVFLIMELSRFLPAGKALPGSLRCVLIIARLRMLAYAVSVGSVLIAVGGSVYLAARLVGNISMANQAKEDARAIKPVASSGADATGVKRLASKDAGLPLDKVWLADHGDGFEFYSNGARVLTEFETAGRERKFYKFHFTDKDGKSFESQISTKPVGIIFHVSESDKLPFAYDYNSSLQSVSRQLLEFAKMHQSYNYIIDRFGRIYRVVRDEDVANHAGYSLWSDIDSFYVNLNSSFIGVCFEGKVADGNAVGADGINEAQIYAARILTAVLRSKYGIDDADCVTHGLVSVNPDNGLLGYHTDWVSQFPFEAIGLGDKYQTELMAISRFGFRYDQAYLASAGGSRWPGLDQADNLLKNAAERDGESIDGERANRFKLFKTAYRMQHALDKAGGEPRSDASD